MKKMFHKSLALSTVVFLIASFAGIQPAAAAEQNTEEISCDLFSVEVPEEIAQISDIEADQESISFYEKIAHPEFGGFVGSIRVFENVQDYCYTPSFSRGGELISPDGTKLDIVLVYPSDVQSDLQNQESIDNWRMIRDSLDESIAPGVIPAEGYTFVPQDEVDNTGVYKDVLGQLAADLQEEKDAEGLAADGFSSLYSYLYSEEGDPLEKVEYAFVDMTGTGYPVLVIYQQDDSVICDMFSQSGGEVHSVLTSSSRDRYSLSAHNGKAFSIREDGSGGADLFSIAFYILDPLTEDLYPQVTFLFDEKADPENPYFVQYSLEEPEPLAEKDWQQRISNFGEVFRPETTPLSDR